MELHVDMILNGKGLNAVGRDLCTRVHVGKGMGGKCGYMDILGRDGLK